MTEPPLHESPQARRLLKIILGGLVAILVVLLLMLIAQYRTLQRQPYFGSHGSMLSSLRDHEVITSQDVVFIESWMTFDYVSRIFSLPPEYLQTTLHISDVRYPHLTIEEYAEDAHLNLTTFLAQLKSTIQSYMSSSQ